MTNWADARTLTNVLMGAMEPLTDASMREAVRKVAEQEMSKVEIILKQLGRTMIVHFDREIAQSAWKALVAGTLDFDDPFNLPRIHLSAYLQVELELYRRVRAAVI